MKLRFEFALSADLATKHFAYQMTGLSHLGQRESAVDVSAVATGTHYPRRFQDRQVLRKVCLRNSKRLLEGRNPLFSPAQHLKQLQALGMSESPADGCLPFEYFHIERV